MPYTLVAEFTEAINNKHFIHAIILIFYPGTTTFCILDIPNKYNSTEINFRSCHTFSALITDEIIESGLNTW